MIVFAVNLPAILAVMKHTRLPQINPLTATCVITDLFSGHMAPKAAIIMPNELGFAKPQIA
jgi:hypothetical protein